MFPVRTIILVVNVSVLNIISLCKDMKSWLDCNYDYRHLYESTSDILYNVIYSH